MRRGCSAFAVTELVVVLAVLALLAGIAVPKFIEAQTRSGLSRAKSDLRSLSVALEAYALDQGAYAFDMDSRGWPWYLTDVMTTPVAYVPVADLLSDPFRETLSTDRQGAQGPLPRYRFLNYVSGLEGWLPAPYPGPFTSSRWCCQLSQATFDEATANYGLWVLVSAGPDQAYTPSLVTDIVAYDPTNGAVSAGDLFRSHNGLSE